MSGSTTSGSKPSGNITSGNITAATTGASAGELERWAALDKQNERLVDASHPLLAELRRDYPEIDRSLPTAS